MKGALAAGVFLCCCGLLRTQDASSADRVECKYQLLGYSVSPDGKKMAEVVGARERTGESEEVVFSRLDQSKPHWTSLFEGVAISQLTWVNDRAIAFVENRAGGHLITEDVGDHRSAHVADTAGTILDFSPSPDGKAILYAFRRSRRHENWVSKAVPDDLDVTAVALPTWATLTDLGSDYGREPTIVAVWPKGPRAIRYSTSLNVTQLAWLGRSSRWTPAVLQLASATSPWEKSLIELSTSRPVIGAHRLGFVSRIAVSQSGLVAVASTGPPNGEFESTEPFGLYVLRQDGHLSTVPLDPLLAKRLKWIAGVWWVGETLLLAEVAEADYPGGPDDHRLLEVDWRSGEIVKTIGWPSGSLDDCRVAGRGTIAVCRADELTESGQLVKVDLRSGSVTLLAPPLSPCVRRIHISFREITVRNRYGQTSTGFLAVPERRAGSAGGATGIPLAVMLYGFDRTFAADGQWIGVYPVARLVSAGVGVLLLNLPRPASWRKGDALAARRQLLEGPVSTVEEAPAAVAATGLRIGRAMVMGWSWGGFVASHVIEESCRFIAAEVGDPASYNIASYALNNATWRGYADALFGGPPDGRYLKNYLAFDPERSGAPPKGPIMLEFVSRNLAAGQYLEEWRAAGAYVEAFAYHFSPHALSVPAEAKVSRERNLLWVELNLLRTGRPTSEKLARVGLTMPPQSAYRCH